MTPSLSGAAERNLRWPPREGSWPSFPGMASGRWPHAERRAALHAHGQVEGLASAVKRSD